MIWTKSNPSVLGWYWHRKVLLGDETSKKTVSQVVQGPAGMLVMDGWHSIPIDRFEGYEWAGPIEEPQ